MFNFTIKYEERRYLPIPPTLSFSSSLYLSCAPYGFCLLLLLNLNIQATKSDTCIYYSCDDHFGPPDLNTVDEHESNKESFKTHVIRDLNGDSIRTTEGICHLNSCAANNLNNLPLLLPFPCTYSFSSA